PLVASCPASRRQERSTVSEPLRTRGGPGDVHGEPVDAGTEHVDERGGGAPVPGGGTAQQGADRVESFPEIDGVLGKGRHLPGPCVAAHRAPPCVCSAVGTAPA